MSKYDVVIIGGGVSGLSCAMTIGSGIEKFDWMSDKSVLVIDAGKSHLNAAQLFNVAGVESGTIGKEMILNLKERAAGYENVTVEQGLVTEVSGSKGSFVVKTEDKEVEADLLVFANGMASIEVAGIGSEVVDHVRAPRPGMVMIENNNGLIEDGKFVTGCAAGGSSMFTTAAGLGAQTATDIISSWTDKYVVVHDVPKKN